MKSLYIKQKYISLKENFFVYDEQEQPVYTIDGSLTPIPKTYTILDNEHNDRASIKRKPWTLLPTFEVEVEKSYSFIVKKRLSLFTSRYSIEGEGVEVKGKIFDMDFKILHNGKEIGAVSKQWLTLTDTYHIEVYDEAWEIIILTLVVAIDRVKEEQWAISTWIDF